MIVIYTNDTIVVGKDKATVEKVILDIATKFTIMSSDKIADFLGVNISLDNKMNMVTLSQPHLIGSIINEDTSYSGIKYCCTS
jgi:hypothetical protein